MPLPLGEVPQIKDVGRRGFVICPLSQKSKRFLTALPEGEPRASPVRQTSIYIENSSVYGQVYFGVEQQILRGCRVYSLHKICKIRKYHIFFYELSTLSTGLSTVKTVDNMG